MQGSSRENRHSQGGGLQFPILSRYFQLVFLGSMIFLVFSFATTKPTFILDRFGLLASTPVYQWVAFSLMLLCTIFSLGKPGVSSWQTLIMIMAISATLSWALPQTSPLPIRADSYDWMQLVSTTLSSGTTANPNQYMRWPIFWVFTTAFASVTSASLFDLFRVLPTVVSLLSPLYFYLVTKEILGVDESLYASLLLALLTAQNHLSPALLGMLMLLFSVYLLVKSSNTRSFRSYLLFFISVLILTMEHHLSSLVLAVLAFCFLVGSYLARKAKVFNTIGAYPRTVAMFCFTSWTVWMYFADINFLATPFRSLLSLGQGTWASNPVTLGLQLSTVHIASGLVFRGILYSLGITGLVYATVRRRRIAELATWFFIMFTAMLLSQLALGGRYPFEPLRFEDFAFFPLLALGGCFIYLMHKKLKGLMGFLVVFIILECFFVSNQAYRGTEVYTQQFFLRDEYSSLWISSETVQPVILTDYRLKSLFTYMITSDSNINNVLDQEDIAAILTAKNISSTSDHIKKIPPHLKSVYIIIDNIQTHISYTDMPYSNEVVSLFNGIPSLARTRTLNKVYDNEKLVIYSSEEE